MKKILIDGREFVFGRRTGIGRFLQGLVDALADSDLDIEIVLCLSNGDLLPDKLRDRKTIKSLKIQPTLLSSEWTLSNLSKEDFHLLISPYPKLPFFGTHCLAVNTIHDVLDLTHPAYRGGFKGHINAFRLKKALRKAALTWFDSSWSLRETEKLLGFIGKNPRVRYPAIDTLFNPGSTQVEQDILKKYAIEKGYILVLGNGLPHKNLGVLLDIARQCSRTFVFAGVAETEQRYWRSRFPQTKSVWLKYIEEEDLPAIIRAGFCLAQPSTAEGYGYPPLEAMASGTPAVVCNIPILIETTGENALIAQANNPASWIEAFLALENKSVYQEQIERGLKWTESLRGPKGWHGHLSDIIELIEINYPK